MNFEIELEKEENPSYTKWHYGNVIECEREFPFSVAEMYESNSDSTEFEITWIAGEPVNVEEIETEILSLM